MIEPVPLVFTHTCNDGRIFKIRDIQICTEYYVPTARYRCEFEAVEYDDPGELTHITIFLCHALFQMSEIPDIPKAILHYSLGQAMVWLDENRHGFGWGSDTVQLWFPRMPAENELRMTG